MSSSYDYCVDLGRITPIHIPIYYLGQEDLQFLPTSPILLFDLRRENIALLISRCIVQFGRIQGYGTH